MFNEGSITVAYTIQRNYRLTMPSPGSTASLTFNFVIPSTAGGNYWIGAAERRSGRWGDSLYLQGYTPFNSNGFSLSSNPTFTVGDFRTLRAHIIPHPLARIH